MRAGKIILDTTYQTTPTEYIILRNIDDLQEYGEYLTKETVNHFTKVVKSDIPVDRWDHMGARTHGGSIFATAILKCNTSGGTPVVECGYAVQNKLERLSGHIMRGETVLLNSVGGYCLATKYTKILEEYEWEMPVNFYIRKNTRYINLENDGILERRSTDYLSTVDPNFSWITRLRDCDYDELVEIFTKFVKQGGDTVHVYTTGSDVEQMYMYTKAAMTAGIKKFEFEFNAGMNGEIEEFINHLTANANVKVMDEDE